MNVRKLQFFLWLALGFVFVAGIPGLALPAGAGEHPEYVRALSELRYARACLDRISYPPVVQDQNEAIHKINAAIGDIKQASADDRQDTDDHPPVDTSKRPHERFQDALAALNRAYGEINRAEDTPKSRQFKQWALRDIDAARSTTQHALSTAKWEYDEKHETQGTTGARKH